MRFRPLLAALCAALLLPFSTPLHAQDAGEVVPIWPSRAPGVGEDVPLENEYRENGHAAKIVHPTLTVMRPPADEANGTSIVVFPGGGYHILAVGTKDTPWAGGLTSWA